MKQVRKSFFFGVVGAVLIAVMIVHAGNMTAEVGKNAPEFTLTDSEGKSHSLSDFKGKYVVLEWTNFQCPFVRKHYDTGNMQKLQKKYTGKDVIWLTVNSSAEGKQGFFEGDTLKRQLQEEKIASTAYLLDTNGKVGREYGAATTPHMYVINPDGVLIYAGAIDDKPSTRKSHIATADNYVEKALNHAMSGTPVPVRATAPYGCSVKY